ncbi:hypothetical protein CYY_002522 [Polysphondylium violaceum]|uniref:RRM domain-containing protein n=1 Tax=Polysphondylium violaceum TaxID=133409 RepID=A0A8J4V9J4_9MYCE|nr:hypothetical protein CYY_002522 [Polysphondylium violaceum]
MNPETTVFVSNISLKATISSISDFFSFCGKLNNLYLRNNPQTGSQDAILVFETNSAATTALLLTNALVVDKVIQVVPWNPSMGTIDEQQLQQQPNLSNTIPLEPQFVSNPEEITHREHPVPDSERSKTSVIASIIAAGYSVGQDAIFKAREVDEEHMISLKLKVGAEAVKAKANEIDNKLHITENATAIKSTIVEKANEIDNRFQISGMFKNAADMISRETSLFFTKASEDKTIAPIVNKVSSIGTSIKQQIQEISDETSHAIDEKKREKGIPVEGDECCQQQQQQPQEQELQQQQYQQQYQQQQGEPINPYSNDLNQLDNN